MFLIFFLFLIYVLIIPLLCSYEYFFPLVPVVKETWAKDAALLEFYSDIADSTIPTIYLGVPNTESGQYL